MPKVYVVRSGDCITSIAEATGFFWETLWCDPENSQLKDKRVDPNCLVQADKVHIMDLRKMQIAKPTDARHRFRRKGVPAKLRIKILAPTGKPHSYRDYRLDIDGHLIKGTIDGDGYLETPVPCGARKGKLILEKDDRHEEGEEFYELLLGTLEPYNEIKGVQERLVNLGAEELRVDGKFGPKTADAVKAFQRANELPETSELDEQTLEKLHDLHGS